MLKWRSTLPAVEDAGEYAMDQLVSAANSAAKSARDVSSQIESWATDGYKSIRHAAKSEPAFWGVMTVGIGAMIGGLYALWRSSGKKPGRSRKARTMAVSSGMSSAMIRRMRAMAGMPAGASKSTPKRARKTRSIKRKKAV